MFRRTSRLIALMALSSLGLATAAPVSAAACSSNIAVNGGTTIYLTPTGAVDSVSGSQIFSDQFPLTVTCGGAPLPGVSLQVSAARADGAPADLKIAVNGGTYQTLQSGFAMTGPLPTGKTVLGTLPATAADGHVDVTINAFSPADQPNLPAVGNFSGFLALQFDVAVISGPGGSPRYTEGIGQIFATPELASLALFGTGASGLVGYWLMRVRATRPKRTMDAL